MAGASPWHRKSNELTITRYSEDEINKAVEAMKARGYEPMMEPKQIGSLYVHHNYNYSTLEKRNFTSKEYSNNAKWVCKMRRVV